ncbi:hypothetical protein BD413DRAFT_501953 [Trametes elegans]|nr:hypothetical protein BD413DRAFT_501953 [Trametes elegans]
MCHWRRCVAFPRWLWPMPSYAHLRHSVRNNYKRCGHYVDLVRLFPPPLPFILTMYIQPDEMVRPACCQLSASSAPRILGIVSRPAARRLAGSSASCVSAVLP